MEAMVGRTDSESKISISVQQTHQEPEISCPETPQNGSADRLHVAETSNSAAVKPVGVHQIDRILQISDLKMPENDASELLEVPKSPTPTPVNKSDERSQVSVLEMPEDLSPKSPNRSEQMISDCKTPTSVKLKEQKSPISGIEFPKNGTPDRLKVPKAFKYPERYTSPTDLMMSPITKGLLARSKRGGFLLPPSKNQLKPMQDLRFPEMNLLYQS